MAGVSLLEISVGAGPSGPVLSLSGESDLSTLRVLSDALAAQMTGGEQHLSIDLSGLRFADSATIRILLDAHRRLRASDRTLELVNPHPNVARSLTMLGVDKLLTMRTGPQAGHSGW